MTAPSVAVVIPAFDRETTVERAVLSALAQTTLPEEVIVVDDGSSDETARLAERAGARVLRQENAGVAAARNAGMRAAGARWVAFLDADDEWLPHHLESLRPHLHDGYGLVACNARGVPSGRLVGHPSRRPLRLTTRRLLWPESPLCTSATAVRRGAALDLGGFGTVSMGEDRLLWLRIVRALPGIALPDVTCLYHEHAEQVSGDVAAMRAARRQILLQLVAAGEVDAKVVDQLDVVGQWDALRESPRGLLAPEVARLALRPHAVGALAQTLVYRRQLRRRAEPQRRGAES